MQKGKILVNGSVVIDIISGENFFGGTGGNIAYGLGQLKASPMLFSLVGGDFKKGYGEHFKKSGVDTRILVDPKHKTASFLFTPQKTSKHKGRWNPNAYSNIHKISLSQKIKNQELKNVSVAIFSPGTRTSILKHILELKQHTAEVTIIFDPGQEIRHFSKKVLEKSIKLSDIFIVNEAEYAEGRKILGKDPRKIFKEKIIIKTKGKKGSVIFNKGKIRRIKAVQPKKVLDTTGAGDAYRAGLIFGLWRGKSTTESCAIGARIASKCVECIGCQQYKIGSSTL